MDSDLLGGKVAFVTGGAGGLGQAIASALAEQGAAVALADLAATFYGNPVGKLRMAGVTEAASTSPRVQAAVGGGSRW